jgi:exopolyphosphatase/guanosine-5'-triphosphate,3'-diphosphate pyrophosphatase
VHLRDAPLVLTRPPAPYDRGRRPRYAVAMRVAAIDCGTNSLRLLVADVDPATGTLRDVTREMVVVRLGEGVDRTGLFAPAALERTFAAVDAYAETCRELGAEAIRFVATSASRDAANSDLLVAGVERRLGVVPEVISGDEEARLSFRGATGALASGGVAPGLSAPFLVVDLGGGSTELVLGAREPEHVHSMNVGCIRLAERHLSAEPAGAGEIELAVRDIRAALDAAAKDVPFARTGTLVGVSGTVTTVTAHVLGLDAYRPDRIDGSILSVDDVVAAADDLLGMTRAARAALPFMHPGRVDSIGAGALVWREVVLRVRREVEDAGGSLRTVVTSEHDILDGIALALVPA